jgi:hypothetical protein
MSAYREGPGPIGAAANADGRSWYWFNPTIATELPQVRHYT